jgi:hypothetical protein
MSIFQLSITVFQLSITLVLSILGILIARWQLLIAKEKLRHDLYDRRLSIYMAFHELIVAIIDGDDNNNVETKLRVANAVRAQSKFLLDSGLEAYLSELHNEAFRIYNKGLLCRNDSMWTSPVDRSQETAQLGQDKLKLGNRVEEMAQKFGCFLCLNDFSSSRFFLSWN